MLGRVDFLRNGECAAVESIGHEIVLLETKRPMDPKWTQIFREGFVCG
jgi:hypothetical protein